jgi:TrmH family RNA methyltransferase
VRVKRARQLSRRSVRAERREFLVEGPQALREALGVPGVVREVFTTADAFNRHADLVEHCAAIGLEPSLCDESALASLTRSVAPQGWVGVGRFVDVPLSRALEGEPRLVAVGAHLRDPGNAGTMIRCADAAGADAVVLAGTSVDPYNDKTVRASVGSIFHLPLVVGTSLLDAIDALHAADFTVVIADGSATRSLDAAAAAGQLGARVAWVFGNEAWGIPPEEQAACDLRVAVPLYGRAESLNVATAAAICLYATAWAQRAGTP